MFVLLIGIFGFQCSLLQCYFLQVEQRNKEKNLLLLDESVYSFFTVTKH